MQLASYPLCRHCEGRGILEPAVEVDHIQRIADGGDWFDPANLQSLCHSCHSRKTKRDEGANVKMGCNQDGIPIDPVHHWNP